MSDFELQLFDGKQYQPVQTGEAKSLPTLARDLGLRAWRVVRIDKGWPDAPRYTRSRVSRAQYCAAQDTCELYATWCAEHGVRPSAVFPRFAHLFPGTRIADPAEWFSPAVNEWQKGDEE